MGLHVPLNFSDNQKVVFVVAFRELCSTCLPCHGIIGKEMIDIPADSAFRQRTIQARPKGPSDWQAGPRGDVVDWNKFHQTVWSTAIICSFSPPTYFSASEACDQVIWTQFASNPPIMGRIMNGSRKSSSKCFRVKRIRLNQVGHSENEWATARRCSICRWAHPADASNELSIHSASAPERNLKRKWSARDWRSLHEIPQWSEETSTLPFHYGLPLHSINLNKSTFRTNFQNKRRAQGAAFFFLEKMSRKSTRGGSIQINESRPRAQPSFPFISINISQRGETKSRLLQLQLSTWPWWLQVVSKHSSLFPLHNKKKLVDPRSFSSCHSASIHLVRCAPDSHTMRSDPSIDLTLQFICLLNAD